MKQSALGSVFFFQRMVIGLDYYRGKESLSRVVDLLESSKYTTFWNKKLREIKGGSN